MLIVDIRHWINEKEEPGIPEVRENVEGIKEIIVYATSKVNGQETDSFPSCWQPGPRKKKKCSGSLMTDIIEPEKIYWKCTNCDFEGTVIGWRNLSWNKLKIHDSHYH